MSAKLFTLEQANRLLPLIRAISADAVRHYRAAKEAIGRLDERKKRRDLDGIKELDGAIAGHLRELRRMIDEIEALGCHLRDYQRGVVDFPAAALDRGGFVYYCWSPGEERVEHWHCDHETIESRRLLAPA